MLLENKVALVTGASRGIGAATAKLLAANGAQVAVNYLKAQEQGQQVVAEITDGGGQAVLVQGDVTQPQDVQRMVEETQKKLGPVDILVNNAAISFPLVPFVKYTWEAFQQKLVDELKASFHTCQAVAPQMMERGQGCIVNVSSGLSRYPAPGFVAHCTAKAALDSFSKSLAMELGRHGIRVNVVAPGLTETDATANQPEEMKQAIARQTPLGRLGQPDDVAGAVLFYCTDWSRFVSGSYLPVSGGIQMP